MKMPFLLVLAFLQTQPQIAQDWTAAVATGLKSATLSLRPDRRFSMRFVESAGKQDTIQGTYTVLSMPESRLGVRRISLSYDFDSLRKAGMPSSRIGALKRGGETGAVGMSLVFYPEVPVLTDTMTADFVPVKGKEAALKRLAKWKPF